MAESSNANAMVSGLKNENILKTIGYFWSDALNCFMFGHGPMTPTLPDVAMITGLDIASPSPSAFKLPKQQDGPEPTQADGSPFKFLPAAPVVLFCQSLPLLKKVIMQSQPISPKSAPKDKASSGPVAPRASIQGCDLSRLLTFDPDSIEPATSKVGEEPSPSAVHGPLQRLKVLLSSSVETLVENPEASRASSKTSSPISRIGLATFVYGFFWEVLEPIAWNGFLLVLVMRAAALVSLPGWRPSPTMLMLNENLGWHLPGYVHPTMSMAYAGEFGTSGAANANGSGGRDWSGVSPW
ncbi:hypothetical protein QYE76_071916 [Lolium multiflorum]|uniref:Uncharacterized protein n=1 Tax=Lolium multiflorum TaxID=4521 RepID=A0AAD8QB49_LOLMU|nr:hypothetical protein QYE76_071916 [Lolium multiflorum]